MGSWRTTGVWLGLILSTAGLLSSCGPSAPVRPNLPPSESDLTLLKSAALCDRKADVESKLPAAPNQGRPWGAGQEVQIPGSRSATQADESYFFDEDGLLVGALFTFPRGLDLDPYPVLRHTLSLLKPTNEFYLAVPLLPTKSNMDTSALFETGDEKTTTQYLVTGTRDAPVLLQASFTIDPYVRLFSPYRREFLARLKQPEGTKGTPTAEGQGSEDKEPFKSLQAFARGQTAQLAYCGNKNYDVALDAYQKAVAGGFANKVWLAEAHHKLGQAWQAKGQLEKAKAEMEKSLAIRPNIPEVLNNLGTVHAQSGDRAGAQALFERAVTLRPNYAVARYNLAEAYESTNPKRAISEYETFLVLVEGIPEEEGRVARAKERMRLLKPEPKR